MVTEHDVTIEVSMSGARAVCSCGWTTHRQLSDSTDTVKSVQQHWYRHYLSVCRGS
jgi:hypothetical protein